MLVLSIFFRMPTHRSKEPKVHLIFLIRATRFMELDPLRYDKGSIHRWRRYCVHLSYMKRIFALSRLSLSLLVFTFSLCLYLSFSRSHWCIHRSYIYIQSQTGHWICIQTSGRDHEIFSSLADSLYLWRLWRAANFCARRYVRDLFSRGIGAM